MIVNSNPLPLLSISQNNITNNSLSNEGELNKEVKVINHFRLESSISNIHFQNTNLHVHGNMEN